MKTIIWSRAKRNKFADALKKAEAANESVFVFEDHDFVVSYARYLLKYLNERLDK